MDGSGASLPPAMPSPSADAGGPPRNGLLLIAILTVAFIEGAAVMVIELTAARIMTPYFGQSVFVWTNVIGIILAALAIGSYAGGRLADRSRNLAPLFLCLFLSGVFCLGIPFFIRGVAFYFMGEGLQLEEAFTLMVRGSFATTLLLFAPPVMLAGACLPFLVKAAAKACGGVGRASGTVYGASTLGSIVGTFLSTYFLIVVLGSKMTFFVTGLVLIILAATGLLCSRLKGTRATGGVLLFLAVLLIFPGAHPVQAFRTGTDVIDEVESRYQYISVVRTPEEPGGVHLCINEGLDSFHSIYVEGDILTGGQYYDYYSLLPVLAGQRAPRKICIVGLAAGTIARQYAYFFGDEGNLAIDGVELDPMTVEMGRKYMGLDDLEGRLTVYGDRDGRMFLKTTPSTYDVIIVDAYAKQVYIPFHMTTREFFQEVHDRLVEGGIMGINVNGFFFDDRVLQAIAGTAASVFGSVSVARVPEGRNFMVYAVRGKGHVDPREITLPERLARLEPIKENIAAFGITRKVTHDPSAMLLTDDKAPLERLFDDDLIQRSSGLLGQVGDLDP